MMYCLANQQENLHYILCPFSSDFCTGLCHHLVIIVISRISVRKLLSGDAREQQMLGMGYGRMGRGPCRREEPASRAAGRSSMGGGPQGGTVLVCYVVLNTCMLLVNNKWGIDGAIVFITTCCLDIETSII